MSPATLDPFALFHRWQQTARGERVGGSGAIGRLLSPWLRALPRALGWIVGGGELPRADAAALATVSAEGRPSVRMVLVKEVGPEGLVFFTNYGSRKAQELEATGEAALVFHWPLPPRQVRVEGRVVRLEPERSDAYFRARPRGSQLGAWASRQSEPLERREALVERVAEVRRRFEGAEVPRPAFWGGYRLIPERLELWQGRPDRLHERRCFVRSDEDRQRWDQQWLQP